MQKGKIKKITALIILIFITSFLLSACSAEGDQVSYAGSAQTPAAADTKASSSSKDDEGDEDDESDDNSDNNGKTEEPENELTDKHVRIRLNGTGEDVFALWGWGRPDYRYGPSIMLGEQGSVDAWFASPADSRKELDWITYRHSDNGGITWGEEKVVLSPTPGTADYKSVCDPDVFYYNGYYYLGYTGTIDKEGLCNSVFLARSVNPDGPYEKWDGKGWGESPVPIVYFEGVDIGWGVGEPSFVVVDDKVYVYNTLDTFSDVYGWVRATQVRTADITDPMWPAKLQFEGTTVFRNDCTDENDYTYSDSDSWDVAYLEESQKFLAVTTNRRFQEDSCLLYYESYDGINFDRVSELNTDVFSGCHNCGLMSDASGHIKKNDKTMIGYAYAGQGESKWGVWATRFVPITIDYTDTVDREEDGAENHKESITIDESLLWKEPIMLLTDQLTYTAYVDQQINIRYYLMNVYRKKSAISADEVKIEKYDPRILNISDDGHLIAVHEGESVVRISHNGLRRDISIRVISDDTDDARIMTFYPVCKRYDIKVNEVFIVKVRPMAVFGDYDLHELSGYELNAYNVKFTSSDTSVCTISKDGTITPIHPGSSVITVDSDDCKYTIEVYVTE